MKKVIIYGFIGLVVIISFIFLPRILTPSMDQQIKNYLVRKGYTESQDGNFFTKNTFGSKINTFDYSNYSLAQSIDDIKDDITSSFNGTFDYKNDTLSYRYRINYGEGVNVIIKGEYVDQKFICEKEFSTIALTSLEKQRICDLIFVHVESFDAEAKTLFSNWKFREYMKQNNN